MRERNTNEAIVVFGGSSGIGLKTVAAYARAGVNVFMGTRSRESFAKASEQLIRREKLDPGTTSVFPFPADVANKDQLDSAANTAKETGLDIRRAVFCQATGMDIFMRELDEKYLDPIAEIAYGTPIEELNREDRERVEEKLAAMREDLKVWTEDALPRAVAVNCEGTFNVLEVLEGESHHPLKNKVLVNSTWGQESGREGVEIPLLYGPVHRSRGLLRDRLRQEGVAMGVVIASMVSDTQVGKMFKDFFYNLMDKDQREAVIGSAILMRDVVGVIQPLLDSDPEQWPTRPYNRFVYKKEGIVVVEDKLELSAMYTHPYRF